jgi:S-adenosylmethionine decarboxylase
MPMDINNYSPGLHKLLTLKVTNLSKLTGLTDFEAVTTTILDKYNLEKVGFSAHVFDNGSYTAAVCLKESHICIHTWPEFSQLTIDIYLCNYLRDNSPKVKDVAADYIAYFEAEVLNDFEINR